MRKPVSELMAAISQEEWAQVPANVLELTQELVRRMDRLEKEVLQLRTENELSKEQLAKTTANLSPPSSKNPLNFKSSRKKPTDKKQGGQLGHKGHERKLYPLEMCQEVIPHYPQSCRNCGAKVIVEENTQPHRHRAAHESEKTSDYAKHYQIREVPPIKSLIQRASILFRCMPMTRKFTCFFIPFFVFSIGCSPTPVKKIQLRNSSEEMQKEVARFISIEIPLLKAKQILEDSEFSCEDYKDSTFSLQKRDKYERKLSEIIVKGNYLSCTKTNSYFIASKTWQVIILHKNNNVALIYAVINHQNL